MAHTITPQVIEQGPKFTVVKYEIQGDSKTASELSNALLFHAPEYSINPNNIPSHSTFYATYKYRVDADYGKGSLVGTPTGTVAITSGRLNLTNGGADYVSYSATSNADSQQVGTIKFKITPNYSGAPAATKTFLCECKAASDNTNLIDISHLVTTGNLVVTLYDKTTTLIFNTSLGPWVPVAGTTYTFKLTYDFTAGSTKLFINDVQFGATIASTLLRDANIGLLRVGSDNTGALLSNFYISDLIVYDTVQSANDYDYVLDSGKTYDKLCDISYNLNGFSAMLSWEATANVPFLTIPKDHPNRESFIQVEGGLSNNAGTGRSGNILISTTGLTSTAYVGHILIRMAWKE